MRLYPYECTKSQIIDLLDIDFSELKTQYKQNKHETGRLVNLILWGLK